MNRPIARKPRRAARTSEAAGSAGRVGLLALALLAGGCAVRPEPLGLAAIEARIDADLAAMFQGQEPLAGPLGLHEAMARAIRYNLEGRLKTMETALAQRQLDLDRFDMLPRIATEAGYEGRSNVLASSSESVETGTQSLEPSTSQEENRFVADLTVVWNVLDFGVSYVAAKQQANRLLIAGERRRKVVHNIIQDVRAAYWRAVAAERLLGRIDRLMARVEKARRDNATLERMRLGDPVRALSYGRALLEATRQLEAQRRELLLAKTELATLANLPPGTDFALETPAEVDPPRIALEMRAMERAALASRPELREEDYQVKISAAESRKALLRLLPGIELDAGLNYDSNDFLVNNNWASYGAKVTWNLLNLISGPAARASARAGEAVAVTRRQALGVAILAQTHVARADYEEAVRQYRTTAELRGLDEAILTEIRNRRRVGGAGELELIQAELTALQAVLRHDLARADVENAFGRFHVTLGADPVPEALPENDLATLAAALAATEQAWRSGTPGGGAEMAAAPALTPAPVEMAAVP